MRKYVTLFLVITTGIFPACVFAELNKIENATVNNKKTSLIAQNKNFSLSFFLTGGIKSGRVEEYVFDGSRKVSYLDWKINPLVFFGGGMKLHLKPYFFINGSFRAAVNNTTVGSMKDYDWDSSGDLFKYSCHNNKLKNGYLGNINVQWHVAKIKTAGLYLGLGYRINHFEFTAVDGYKEYPPGSNPVSVSGDIVAYRQTSHIPYYMAGMSGPFIRHSLSWFIFLLHSPFVITEALDNHFLTHTQYDDLIIGASFVGMELGIKWQISYIVLQLQVSLENTFPCAGSTENTDTQTGYVSPETDGGGAGYMAVTVEMSVICIFF